MEEEEHIEQTPSLIDTVVLTKRPKQVKIEFYDKEGEEHEGVFEGVLMQGLEQTRGRMIFHWVVSGAEMEFSGKVTASR